MNRDTRRLVLYVEDHAINALLMAAIFEHRPKLGLVIATSGEEAMSLAQRLRPELMMLDIGLPDCHGTDLLQRLRSLPGYERVPAVAVTANSDFDIARTGFRELWPKPLMVERVLPRLDALTAVASFPLVPEPAALATATRGAWPLGLASA